MSDRHNVIIELDEVVLYKVGLLDNGGISIVVHLHKDDSTSDLLDHLRNRPTKYYHLIMSPKNPDEHHSRERSKRGSESTGRPAPGGDSARVKSMGNVGYGHASHGDWQGFLFDISPIIMQDPLGVGPRPVNPVERKNLAADLIRQWCKVGSMSEITPGSAAAERFRWLEAAFQAEKDGMDPAEILEAHS